MGFKMKKKTFLIGLMAVLVISSHQPVFADEQIKYSASLFAGYYNTSSSNFNDVDASFETAMVFGGAVSYHFTPQYSIELWTTKYTTDMNLSFDDKNAKLGGLDQTPILLTGRFQFPIRKSNADIYLGAGVGYAFNDFKQVNRSDLDDFFAVNLETKQMDDCIIWALNVGAEMRIKKDYALFVDLKTIFSEPSFDVVFEDGTTSGKNVGLNASVFSFGFKYLF